MESKRRFTVKDMIYIGILGSMCVIATSIKIPFGIGAMVHLGTGFIFTAAIIFGGIYAGLSAAVGSALFDLIMGFSPYTLWSFIIKGMSGFIAGTIARGLWPEANSATPTDGKWLARGLFGCFAAAAWTLAGYVIAWWQVSGSLTVALNNIPSSLMTSGVGLVIALLAAPRLRNIVNR